MSGAAPASARAADDRSADHDWNLRGVTVALELPRRRHRFTTDGMEQDLLLREPQTRFELTIDAVKDSAMLELEITAVNVSKFSTSRTSALG